MAEEQIAELTPQEGVVVEQEQTAAPLTVEDFARDRGWRPKEEYNGNPDDWRDAATFVSWGLDRNRDLSRDVKHLRETTERMSRTTADLMQQAVDRARAEERSKWEKTHQRAVEEGDLTTATEAVTKIAELAQPAPKPPEQDGTVQSFIAENSWFTNDPAAKAVAVAVSDAHAHLPIADQLAKAREAVLKRFPEYAPPAPKPPASVAAPTARAMPSAGRKKGFGDLPADAQSVARQLVSRGLIATVDGYAEQYFASKAG